MYIVTCTSTNQQLSYYSQVLCQKYQEPCIVGYVWGSKCTRSSQSARMVRFISTNMEAIAL